MEERQQTLSLFPTDLGAKFVMLFMAGLMVAVAMCKESLSFYRIGDVYLLALASSNIVIPLLAVKNNPNLALYFRAQLTYPTPILPWNIPPRLEESILQMPYVRVIPYATPTPVSLRPNEEVQPVSPIAPPPNITPTLPGAVEDYI